MRSSTLLAGVGGLAAVAALVVALLAVQGDRGSGTDAASAGPDTATSGDSSTDERRESATGGSSARLAAADVSVATPEPDSDAVPTAGELDLKDIEKETDPNRVKWRVLRYSLQEYRKLTHKDARGPREAGLVCDSVATLLQLSGRDQDPDWSASAPEGQYYMINNGRGYSWSVGEFPEYDAWRRFTMFDMERYSAAKLKNPGLEPQLPHFDQSYFELIELRAVEAIHALESRYGFH